MHHSDSSQDTVDVRPADISDSSAIALLATAVFTADEALVPFTTPSVEDIRAFLARSDGGAYVAASRGVNVGTASFVLEGNVVHLFRLAVDERWRRRGVGTALVGAIEDIARARGAAVVYLQTPRVLGLIEWYERLGYAVDREEREVIRGETVVMVDMTKIL